MLRTNDASVTTSEGITHNEWNKTQTRNATLLMHPVSHRDHCQGSQTAPITLVEYGDYQCPSCCEANTILQSLQVQLGEQLCFVFRHFPLTSLHPYAQNAAEAAEAAAVQGQFWQMHHCLFQHQASLDNGLLVECADAIRLDIDRFLYEMSEHIHSDRVREDIESAIASGVSQTPTFFINRIRYDGDWNAEPLLNAMLLAIGEA